MHPTVSDTAGSADVTETRPMCCVHVGLDCQTCVRQSARKVAVLCAHLSEDQQKGVFLKLYPDRVCHVNTKRFQKEYAQVTGFQPLAAEDLQGAELDLALA